MADWVATWVAALETELEGARALREQLHQNPRVSGEESDTTRTVAEAMEEAVQPIASTGGWCRLGPEDGPAIGLRGELDALPVEEKTGLEWASTNGAMHACGHDVHLAALTAVVRAARAIELPFGLVPLLQPREEAYPSGAYDIREAGLLEEQRIKHVIGVHVHPGVSVGSVATGAGFVNADASEITITVTGEGGHGAYPHLASDVVGAIGHILTGLPETMRRTVDPMDASALSVGTVQVGAGAANVLPASGTVRATLRTTNADVTDRIVAALTRFVNGQAASFGCTAELDWVRGEPALINDEALTAEIDRELQAAGLEVAPPMRSMGADDFSFFSDQVPSTMCFVGVESAGRATLHDSTFLPIGDALQRVARTYIAGYAGAAKRLLKEA